MQNIQKLSLILVKSLNLDIENGVRVNLYTVVLQNIFRQTLFVLELDVHKLLLRFFVICINSQFLDLGQICDPVRTNVVGYPVCQKLISVKQETSLGDTVCLIVEFLRHHFIEISQRLILQNLCVQSCNAVYRIACSDCKMCHLHLTIPDNCHLSDFLEVSRIFCLNIKNETTVDFFDDLVNTRKQFGEQVDRPFLQSLCHNSMVGISTCFCGNCPCIVPAKTFLIHKDTHQFGNSHGRMGIVHLEGNLLMKLSDIVMCLLIFLNSSLQACGNKEVLLFQTKLFTGSLVVIRIKYVYDILCQVLLLNSLFIITLVKRVKTKFLDCSSIPDTQSVYHIVFITNDRHIVRNCFYRTVSFMDELVSSSCMIIFYSYISAEMNFLCIFRATKFKWVAVFQPCIRNL